MKAILFGLATLAIGLVPTTTATATTPEQAGGPGSGLHDPHRHGWYVHYRHHGGGHHVAGPFQSRHAAEDHAHHLRHHGYHIERIVRD